jgi:hypothetical protein
MYCVSQRVMVSNLSSSLWGCLGTVERVSRVSGSCVVRLDRDRSLLAFGESELVPAPSGNRASVWRAR